MNSNPPAPLRLGIRAHDVGRLPAPELARAVASLGLTDIQLAVNKALAGPDLQPGQLTPELARTLAADFAAQQVGVAVLGCYINPIHPDDAELARLVGWFKEHLRFARDLGCRIVALETGSMNADYSPHPDNTGEAAFSRMLRTFADLVDTAEKHEVIVGVEGVASHTVSTPARMRRLLDTIRSPHLRVVLDPVNLLNADTALRQREIVAEALALYGDRIAIIHAKDFRLVSGRLRVVPAGRGELDYAPLLRWLSPRAAEIPVLLEETRPPDVPAAREHLADVLRKVREPEPPR
jgi:sugar phosphate isomerase/epimerase